MKTVDKQFRSMERTLRVMMGLWFVWAVLTIASIVLSIAERRQAAKPAVVVSPQKP